MYFPLNLEKAVLKLKQNLTSKLEFNGFLFSLRLFSSEHTKAIHVQFTWIHPIIQL